MRKLVVLSALVIGVCATSTAEAHMLPLKKGASVKQQYVYWQRSENHATYNVNHYTKVIKWFHIHAAKTLKSPDYVTHVAANDAYRHAKLQRRAHLWLLKFSQYKEWTLQFYFAPPHHKGWLCIHSFEGAWSDSGDPYWGGLQMDRGFMSTYAPQYPLRNLLSAGLANSWTPLEQEWVAEFAYASGRGYGPWPNTARYCGLL